MSKRMRSLWVGFCLAAVGCGGQNATAPSPEAVGPFSLKMTAPSQVVPVDSASGDLNGDGIPDLAVLYVSSVPEGSPSAFVTVYHGPFAPGAVPEAAERYDAAPTASALAVADLNGDGVPDLVIAERLDRSQPIATPGRIRVIFRDGSGGTLGQTEALLGLDAVAVRVADVTGDGIPDLVASGSGYVFVAPGLGAGAFDVTEPIFTSGPWTLGDFSGDGRISLAVANRRDPAQVDLYRWLEGLTLVSSVSLKRPVSVLAAADVTGDGAIDLIAGTSDPSAPAGGTIEIAPNAGPAGWGPVSEIPTGPVLFLALGPFEGNGTVDLVLSTADSSWSQVLAGDGSGGFRAAPGIDAGSTIRGLKSTDLGGGRQALVVLADAPEVLSLPTSAP